MCNHLQTINITNMLNRIIDKIKKIYYQSTSERYCNYLRSKGIHIGKGTKLRSKRTNIDITRPSLVSIGDNCYLNDNFTLLTHDWVTGVFIKANMDFLPSSGRITIGNNVAFGQNVMVLKGVTIGDNCFIGAGSIVTKDIPSNSIAVGIPCKVICTLEEFHKKRQSKCIDEALDYARSIKERFGRKPLTTDFWEEFPLFVDGDKINDYPELADIIKNQLGPTYDNYQKSHKAKYKSFNEFLAAAGIN